MYSQENKQRPQRKNKVYAVFNLSRNSDKYYVQRILLDEEQESLKILAKTFKLYNFSRLNVRKSLAKDNYKIMSQNIK